MSPSQTRSTVIKQLILKDWQLNRRYIVLTILFGVAALGLLLAKRAPITVVGGSTLFIAIILVGCFLPALNILNERKKQTLPFLMSLPISAIDYTTVKLLGTVGMFLVPWLTLVVAAASLILVKGVLPHGVIPMTLIVLTLPFIGLCLITAATLVGETEGWCVAANVVCNSSYGLIWYFIAQTPSLMRDLPGPRPVWSSAVLTFLGCEFASIALVLSVTYYLQSRKRDFV
jgi:ABC-2 type transport system permease protein